MVRNIPDSVRTSSRNVQHHGLSLRDVVEADDIEVVAGGGSSERGVINLGQVHLMVLRSAGARVINA